MDIKNVEVGRRIREIRKEKLGLSMSEFASKIDSKGKSGTVSNWETGKNLPNNERIKRIAELGNISVDELLYGTKEEIAKKAIDDALDEYILTSTEYYHDYMDNKDRYTAILNDLYKKYMNDVGTIPALWADDPYTFLKEDVFEVFEEEFMKDERTRENMLNYLLYPLEQAKAQIEDYRQDNLTQEAIKNGSISENDIIEVINKIDRIYGDILEKLKNK